MSKMKNIKINALTNMLVRVLNIVFPLITGPYISRILSKLDYGNFNVANTVINIFIPFATLGIYNYGIREISKVKNDKDKLNQTFSNLFFISLVSTVLTTIIYYFYIHVMVDLKELTTLYNVMGVQIFAQLFYIEWVNEAFENYKFILYKTLFVRLLMFGLIFGFVKEPEDILPYTIIMTAITFINFFISFVWIKREVNFVPVQLKKLKRLMLPIFSVLLIANANMLYTYLDQIFLSKIGIVEHVTYYVIGYNLVTIIARVISGAVSVSVPRLGYYLGQGQYDEYQRLINKTAKVFFFFLVPMCIGLYVLGTPATLLYGGDKYFLAGLCTMLFAIRTIGWGLEIIFGTQIILVSGYENKLTILYFIGGGTNLLFNMLLYYNGVTSPEYYIVTTMIAEIVLLYFEYRFIELNHLAKTQQLLKELAKYTGISLPFIPIMYGVRYFFSYTNRVDFALFQFIGVTMGLCVVYYALAMFFLKDEIFIMVLASMQAKIRRKV